MKQTKLLAALALILPAMAHGQGFYAGLDVGDARSDANIGESPSFAPPPPARAAAPPAFGCAGVTSSAGFSRSKLAYVDFGDVESHFDPDDCPNGAPGPCPLDVRTSSLDSSARWWAFCRSANTGISMRAWAGASSKSNAKEIGGSWPRSQRTKTRHSTMESVAGTASMKIGESCSTTASTTRRTSSDTLDGDFGVYDLGETSVTSLGVSYRW